MGDNFELQSLAVSFFNTKLINNFAIFFFLKNQFKTHS